MDTTFICPRCGNSDPRYIGSLNGRPYCRFCISMNGKSAKTPWRKNGAVVLKLDYELSKEQKEISDKIVSNYKEKKDTLVNAVCGAGKTELVYQVIAYCLSEHKTVAFAVPRRDVVIELWHRIHDAFPSNYIVDVFGSHSEKLEGDVVVLTTHQLYRYEHYFDLIILDEIDAFPFKDNRLLSQMFFRAVRGNIVMMSATPSDDIIEYFSQENKEILELNTRFHRHPLPVPEVVVRVGITKFLYLVSKIKTFIKEEKKVFIFAPTIDLCEKVFRSLKPIIKNGDYVHSKRKTRNEIIKRFKEGKYDYLVTTAVLERGVTFKNLQVIIFSADNDIYDSASLIQIAGRVGRKYDAPEGEVIFLVNKSTESIEKAIRTIESKNTNL